MKDNKNNTPSMQGGLHHVLKEAAERAEQMAKIMMVPPGLREEFYKIVIGEFIIGVSSAFQIRKLVDDHPDAETPDDGESFNLIRQLAENVGYKTTLAGDADKELSDAVEKVKTKLTGVRKELIESLPPEVRDVALKMIAQFVEEDGVDPNDVDLKHLKLGGIDPSQN